MMTKTRDLLPGCSGHDRFHHKGRERVGCCGFEFTKWYETCRNYRVKSCGTIAWIWVEKRRAEEALQRHVPLGESARDTFVAQALHVDALEKRLAGSSYWFWTNTIAERDWHNDTRSSPLPPLPVYKLRDNFPLPSLLLFLPFPFFFFKQFPIIGFLLLDFFKFFLD